MAAIGVQEADSELIAKQAQFSRGEIKERANARIGLAIVVAVRTFVVPRQRGPAIVCAQLPALAEILADFNFNRLVGTNWLRGAVRLAVRPETPGGGRIQYANVGLGAVKWVCVRPENPAGTIRGVSRTRGQDRFVGVVEDVERG